MINVQLTEKNRFPILDQFRQAHGVDRLPAGGCRIYLAHEPLGIPDHNAGTGRNDPVHHPFLAVANAISFTIGSAWCRSANVFPPLEISIHCLIYISYTPVRRKGKQRQAHRVYWAGACGVVVSCHDE